MKVFLKPLSIFLSVNLFAVQLAAAVPQIKSGKIHVGYIGENFDGVPDAYQKLVHQKMLGLVNQNYYEFHNPTDLTAVHNDVVAAILVHDENSFSDNLAGLSKAADLDYIFVTSLKNISDNNSRVMLKGEIIRYNRKTNDLYRHEVLTYAEDFDLHIRAMRTEMIETIPHSVHGLGRNRTYVLVGVGIILAFALSQSFSELAKYISGGDDDDTDTGQPGRD